MTFDEMLQRIEQRVLTYHHSRQPEVVLDNAVLIEADELWQAAQHNTSADNGKLTTEDDQRLAKVIRVLGWLHYFRYTAVPARRDLVALARAIVFLQPLAQHLPSIPRPLHVILGPSAELRSQAALAEQMLRHAEIVADSVVLQIGIRLLTAAFEASSPDHPDRVMLLSSLSNAHRMRFERGGAVADIDHAIEWGSQAVAAAPEGYPNHAGALYNLGVAHQRRFEHAGVTADLDRAIELGSQVVATTPAYHPSRARCLCSLGIAYRVRFEHAGIVTDLDRAIELGGQAVAAVLNKGPDQAMCLSSLGNAYQRLFEQGGVVADLNRAIDVLEQATATTHPDSPNLMKYLFNLGGAYQQRFNRAGVVTDLNRAIELGEQVVAATLPGNPDRIGALTNLGNVYRRRFERTGVVADLDRVIGLLAEAVATGPPNQLNRAIALSSFSNAYLRRFERTGVVADLDRAIALGEQAVAAAPADNFGHAMSLHSLAVAHKQRFKRTGVVADLDRAIALGEQAVAAAPAERLGPAEYLSVLGGAYQMRFERGGVVADLDRAVELGTQAVTAIPVDHPALASLLSNLGNTHRVAVEAGAQRVNQETLYKLARLVDDAVTANPSDRVLAGHAVGSLASAVKEHGLAVDLLDAAVALLPSLAPRESGWEDQEHRLGQQHGLVEAAIAAHCAIDDPVGAVEIAELGRGVLLANQLDFRTDLTDLDYALPDLAARLRRLRVGLNTPHPDNATVDEVSAQFTGWVEHRKLLWAEHDELLTEIRGHADFERFLRPPRLADLEAGLNGADGPVIMVNTGARSGTAIILTSGVEPTVVPLPELKGRDVGSYSRSLLAASYDRTLAGTLQRQRVIPETLAWLWDTIVNPILQNSSLSDGGAGLPRVWWLPTGRLGVLPLHAAGHRGQPGALDTMISSYTPTLRALVYARNRPASTARRQLTVAMQSTSGLPDLPGTVAEAATLHAYDPNSPLLTDDTATIDRVLAALPDATWAHFACHAAIDFAAPSRSGLRLHDATLSLPQISRLHLTQAELAYLSACSTAHRSFWHADESLHSASAFQLAGFRHVIASLWPLADHVAADAAAAFYQHMPSSPAADHAATALHKTSRGLRALYPTRPDLWAALIHSGP